MGTTKQLKALKAERTFELLNLSSPYELKDILTQNQEPIVVIHYLPFLEMRHFELYSHFQKNHENLQTIFVVKELSGNMKLKLKHTHDFIVLWTTEEGSLVDTIKMALAGKQLRLRQDRRETHAVRGLLSAAHLPTGKSQRDFLPMLPGSFENVSESGSCFKICAEFYAPKDFVSLSYQNKQGDFVTVQGQVRWSKWNPQEQVQELGLHFVSST